MNRVIEVNERPRLVGVFFWSDLIELFTEPANTLQEIFSETIRLKQLAATERIPISD